MVTLATSTVRNKNSISYLSFCSLFYFLNSIQCYTTAHNSALNEHNVELLLGVVKVLDPWNDLYDNWGKGAYDRFSGLKSKNPALKTILAVGGWNEGSRKYSQMAADPVKRKIFISSCVTLLLKHNFDGLDMDWEYPGSRGGIPADKLNFVTLLRELKAALRLHNLLLTAAVPAGVDTIRAGFDIPALSQHLDYINLMTYDFHGAWEDFTHHLAPLAAHPLDSKQVLTMNVIYAVDYWLSEGAPAHKLVIGLALYGRCYTLNSLQKTGYYARAFSPGRSGPYTATAGVIGYNELCEMQMKQDWITVYDQSMNEPYSYHPASKTWCGYDDPYSLSKKSQWARDRGLAGVMFWSLETDDFRGRCPHHRPFELVKISVKVFRRKRIPASSSGAVPSRSSVRTALTQPTSALAPATNTFANVVSFPSNSSNSTVIVNRSTGDDFSENAVSSTVLVNSSHAIGYSSLSNFGNSPATAGSVPANDDSSQATVSSLPATAGSSSSSLAKNPLVITAYARPNCTVNHQVFFSHHNCERYWMCVHNIALEYQCPKGLVWNPMAQSCDFSANVDITLCQEPSQTRALPGTSAQPRETSTRSQLVKQTSTGSQLFKQTSAESQLVKKTSNTAQRKTPHCDSHSVYLTPAAECNKFWWCVYGAPILSHCPQFLIWNQDNLTCDYPRNVHSSNCSM